MRRDNAFANRLLVALLLGLPMAGVAAQEQEQESDSQLQLTSAVTVGHLENGLRYYLQRNTTPQETIELRLVVQVGSVHEGANELGVAHFVEHMAFNGTERFPGNEIIGRLETLGVSYGADLNAYTGFDNTVYTLQVSTTEPAALATALDILEQWAFHISFTDEEIEKERGVILEEWRRQQIAERRAFDQHLQVLLRPARYAARLPIGNEEIISTVSAETIRAFYRRWYRPGRMALIAVGDIDREKMSLMIAQRFGTAPSSEYLAARPGGEGSHEDLRVSAAYDSGITSHSLTLYQRQPADNTNSVASYRDTVVQALFGIILNDRLEELAAHPKSPLLNARISLIAQRLTANEDVMLLRATFAAGEEENAIAAVVSELKQIISYNIDEGEFAHGVTRLQRLYQSYWDGYDTQESNFFAAAYIAHFIYGNLLLDPSKEEELLRQLLPTINRKELVHQAIQLLYGPNRLLALSGVAQENGAIPTIQQLHRWFSEAAHRVPPATRRQIASVAPVESLVVEDQFSREGAIVEERYDAQLGLHHWQLSNGMQVILKETDFESDKLLLDIYSKGGYIMVPEADYPAARVAVDIVEKSGLAQWSPSDLRRILANRALTIQPYLRQFSEGLSGSASPNDIAQLLQIAYLYFAEPRYDSVRAEAHLRSVRSQLEFRHNSPRSLLADRLIALLYNNHPLVRTLTTTDIDAINSERSYTIYKERFQNAADFTALLVGDISPDELRPHLHYLAQIAAVGPTEDWKPIQYLRNNGSVQERLQRGEDELGLFRSLFWGDFQWSLDEHFILQSLAQALTNRLQEQLREEFSAVYSVGSFASSPRLPTDYYLIFIDFTTDPVAIEEVIQQLNPIIDSLHETPLSAEELQRIQETERSNFVTSMRENGFWLDLLRYADLFDYDPVEALQREARVDKLTAEVLQGAARRYLNRERYLEIYVGPE